MSELALQLIAENKRTKNPKLDLGRTGLTELPEELFECVWLEELNLSDNKITNYRSLEKLTSLQSLNLSGSKGTNYRFLGKLTSLQSLNLSGNRITNTHFLEKLTSLQSLNLSGIKITNYRFLGKLTSLQSLDLSDNKITYIYYFLEELTTGLQSLNLSSNQIADAYSLERLTSLQSLNLNTNRITDAHFLEKLTSLKSLDLNSNGIRDISFLEKLTSLQSLYLRGIQKTDYRFLEKLTSLQSLDLGFNRITDTSFLEKLTSMQSLYLNNNRITDTSFLEKLTSMQLLDLSSNYISNVRFLEKLIGLQSLDLSSTYISDYSFLKNLINLKLLNLNSNNISDISFLKNIAGLQALDLNNNKISDITFLEKLISVKRLDISKNQIEDISLLLPLLQHQINNLNIVFKDRGKLGNSEINLNNNPLKEPPVEIAKLGNKAVIDYFDERKKQGTEYLYEAKMLIVGQPRAGKTSLRVKLFNMEDELPAEDKTTRGIDIQQLEFDILAKERKIQKFKYNIWDFGGQQIYQTTHQFFLTQRSLYVLVMDTGKDSIGNDDTTINYWLQVVELLGKSSPLLLVRNEKNERQINIDLPQKKARFSFLKTDYNIDLNALIPGTPVFKESRVTDFNRLKKDIETELERLPLVGFPMPRNWVRIRENLRQLSETFPYINRKEYMDICSRFEVTDFEKQMELSRIFHDLGVFLHFQDYVTLEDFIILQNVWATDAVFAVLDNPEVQANKGKFTESSLAAIWKAKDYEPIVHKKLLGLMMQFELCYQVDKVKNSIYIVPEMLPDSAPEEYKWQPANDLPLQYRYDFMPKGLLTRLIVRLHKHIAIQNNQQSVWKTGVKIDGTTLDCPNTYAEITEAWNNKQLLLRVHGPHSKDLMSKITFEIDLLNGEFFKSTDGDESKQKSRWHKMIPCNCETCCNSIDKHFYDYAILLNAREKNKDIQCQKSFNDVNVDELLGNIFSKQNINRPDMKKNATNKLPQIFISYSHLDEKPWKDEMVKHLSALKNQELISAWTDRQIEAGMWNEQIEEAMEKTDIFLLLITQNFLASSYITSKEITKAYEMYKAGRAKIFPVICDSCKWELQPITKTEKEMHPTKGKEMYIWLGKFQPFPKDGTPIQNWPNKNDGFLDVINQLERHL